MYNKSLVIPGLIIILLIIFSPILYNASTFGLKEVPKPEIKAPPGKGPTSHYPLDFWRVNHMKGLNTTLLDRCMACHTERSESCDRCHEYVGAKPWILAK